MATKALFLVCAVAMFSHIWGLPLAAEDESDYADDMETDEDGDYPEDDLQYDDEVDDEIDMPVDDEGIGDSPEYYGLDYEA